MIAGAVDDVLVAEGLTRSFPFGPEQVPVIRRASLRVARQEVVAILGRSGAGKSTLLAICGGLDRPDQGRVVVDGRDVRALTRDDRERFLQRTVGWVFQTPHLVPLLTATENVALVMQIAGQPEADALRLTQMALEAVGLDERADRRVTQLSRGERQRVALARALVKSPALVVADEPTAQLDSRTAAEILALLRDAAHSDVAVLFTTHDETEIRWADRFLVMDDGILRDS